MVVADDLWWVGVLDGTGPMRPPHTRLVLVGRVFDRKRAVACWLGAGAT